MKLCPPWPDIEMMLTIEPSIFSRFMTFSASCIRKNGARTLTANMASNSSGLVSQIEPRSVMPAELTRMSTRPNALSASATTLSRVVHRRRGRRDEDRLDALRLERGLDLFAARRVAAGDDQAGNAALGKEMGDRLAQPLRRAGDDGDLALERGAISANDGSNIVSAPQPIFTGLPVSRDFGGGVGQHLRLQPVDAVGRRLLARRPPRR